MPTPTSSTNRPADLSAQDYQQTFADRVWYSIGGVCALLIVVSLWLTDAYSATKTLCRYRDTEKSMKEMTKNIEDAGNEIEKSMKEMTKNLKNFK